MHPLKQYAKENKIKPKKLAFRLGISTQYLYLIFSSQRWPRFALAEKIEEMTGIPACDLWTYNRHKK